MKKWLVMLSISFALAWGSLSYVDQYANSQGFDFQVSFIDVGQGDSALIQAADGTNLLIDGGVPTEGPTVLAYLRDHGVYTLNAIIASHADSDHIGGLISILEATDISVDEVIYNGYPGTTDTWDDFVSAVAKEGLSLTKAQFPEELNWGNTTVYILNPPAGLTNPDTNEASLVMLFTHGQVETLFTGDIDSSVESQVIARGTPVAADILKVAHHGSDYSSSVEFLNAVQPMDSIISVGTNPYGHPGDETIARLLASGTEIWRTDQSGTILVASLDGITYQVIPSFIGIPIFLPIITSGN